MNNAEPNSKTYGSQFLQHKLWWSRDKMNESTGQNFLQHALENVNE